MTTAVPLGLGMPLESLAYEANKKKVFICFIKVIIYTSNIKMAQLFFKNVFKSAV